MQTIHWGWGEKQFTGKGIPLITDKTKQQDLYQVGWREGEENVLPLTTVHNCMHLEKYVFGPKYKPFVNERCMKGATFV